MTPCTVVVVDPSAMYRAGLRALLEQAGFTVLEARRLEELDGLALGDPTVAVVGLDHLPSGDAAPVERASTRRGLRTLVWSSGATGADVFSVVAAGAQGFVRKQAPPAALVDAVRTVASGGIALDADGVRLFVEGARRRYAIERASASVGRLSARERSVLELVSRGLRNREIAEALAVSEFTVKRHVQNILTKLDLPSRQRAAELHRLGASTFEGRGVAA